MQQKISRMFFVLLFSILVNSYLQAQQSDRHALDRIFGETIVPENVDAVHRQAMTMRKSDRIDFLMRWIFPSDSHAGFRMAGSFSQANPAPVSELFPEDSSGSRMISPIYDLLDALEDPKALDMLIEKIDTATHSKDPYQTRARAAMLGLVNLQRRNHEGTSAAIEQLLGLPDKSEVTDPHDYWPEILLIDRGMTFGGNPAIHDLLDRLFVHLKGSPKKEPWPVVLAHLAALSGRMRWNELRSSTDKPMVASALRDWIPVSACTARTRGDGFPNLNWESIHGEIHHQTGHHHDYLFYFQPLCGDFSVECDVSAPDRDGCGLMAQGSFFGARQNLFEFERGTFDGTTKVHNVMQRLATFDAWVHLRSIHRDGWRTQFINGKSVDKKQADPNLDPWIAVHSSMQNHGAVRDIRITGDPKVADVVNMSASRELYGWLAYFDDTVGNKELDWHTVDDPQSGLRIVGPRTTKIDGSSCESLLRYQRPLIEDGSIEYEFLYQPGSVLTYPALDRLTFILDPTGVRIHWLTDGLYDRTEVPPDNLHLESGCRRGPAVLPLKMNEWNQVRLSIRGAIVELVLNEQIVYERPLEASNQRTFGLFHYADRSEAQVRNCRMRGDWSRTVPAPYAQEMSHKDVFSLDRDVQRLKAVFDHDFRIGGLPGKYFAHNARDTRSYTVSKEGLNVTKSMASGNQATFSPRFSLYGDFDIVASFDNLDNQRGLKECGIQFSANIHDSVEHTLRMHRTRNIKDRQVVRGQLGVPQGNAVRVSEQVVAAESNSGTLRMARRGERVFTLFAENDSEAFRLISSDIATDQPVDVEGIVLAVITAPGGQVEATWTSIRLRAEKMMYHPGDDGVESRMLRTLNIATGELRDITGAVPGYSRFGSPEWSSDRKKIAFDATNNSTVDAHIIIIDVESGERKDVGLGCMPSFSPDGERIVYSHPGDGVGMMNSDGSNRTVLDRAGWSGQWSPDGKWIVYFKNQNIVLMDANSRRQRLLLEGDQATRYSEIFWNLGWSHDSRAVGFKARTRTSDAHELAVVDIDNPKGFEVLYEGKGIIPDITWTLDNQQVVFAMKSPGQAITSLYTLTRGQLGSLKPWDRQPKNLQIFDGDLSSDGQYMLVVSQKVAQPVEWLNVPVK